MIFVCVPEGNVVNYLDPEALIAPLLAGEKPRP
jgi:hypothetical protein